jgi:hypothetical protein
MKTSELKQSKYLKKEDCGDDGILVTITGIKQENVAMEGKPDDLKWVMSFSECKPMVLNGTNSQLIEKALGSDETDDWHGKKIVLFHDENVSFGGELVGGIRCDVSRTKRYHAKLEKSPAVTPPKRAAAADQFEDDIPF